MSKTPEEMALEYIKDVETARNPSVTATAFPQMQRCFLAGYKAAQQWISAKERLPEPNTLVVILHEDEMNLNYRKPPVYFGKHDGKYWLETLDHSDVAWQGPCCITHWMPLPEPPKEEE